MGISVKIKMLIKKILKYISRMFSKHRKESFTTVCFISTAK